MTRFAFTARSATGETITGVREANSEAALLEQLRASGLLTLKIRGDVKALRSKRRFAFGDLMTPSAMDVELEIRQLAFMLRSGVPLLSALRTCADQGSKRAVSRVLRSVSESIQTGSTFADALRRHRCFPKLLTSLVAVGEQTGSLEVVIERAADAMERRRMRRSTIITALTYPTIVVVLAVATVAYIMVGLIPKLATFLNSFGRTLPGPTQFLVDTSAWVASHLTHLVVGVAALVALALILWFGPARRRVLDPVLLKTPLLGSIVKLSAAAAFSHNLALLLASGVRLTPALDIVAPLVGNHRLTERIGAARERVLHGWGLSEALAAKPRTFGPMLTSMVAVGETAGTLDTVLVEVAEFHDSRLQLLIRRLGTLIEPAIIVVIGGLVGFVYLAFFMALYSFTGSR